MYLGAGGGGCQIDPRMPAKVGAVEVKPLSDGRIAGRVETLGEEISIAIARIPGWLDCTSANGINEGSGEGNPTCASIVAR
jgi:hypothetical protein